MKARAKLVAVMLGCFCVLTFGSLLWENSEAAAQESAEVKDSLDLGVRLYAEGRYRDALSQFNRVLVIDPENKIAQKYVQECTEYLKPGLEEEVEVVYPEKAAPPPVPVGPTPEEVRQAAVDKYLGFGQDYYDKKEYGRAIEEWERVLLIDPTNKRAIESILSAKSLAAAERAKSVDRNLKLQRELNAPDITEKLFRPVGSDVDGIKPFRITLPPVEKKKEEVLLDRMGEIADKLVTRVSLDFTEGTDIRDVLSFLSDFAGVNIVLDERVMLPPTPPPTTPGAPGAVPYAAGPYAAGPYGRTGSPYGGSPYSARGRMGSRAGRPGTMLGPTTGGGPGQVLGGDITPNVASEVRRIYLNQITLQDALKAMLSQMGLSYKVQPEFIWVSRPDILRRESFEPLETRYYLLQNAGGESLPKVAMMTRGGMGGGMGMGGMGMGGMGMGGMGGGMYGGMGGGMYGGGMGMGGMGMGGMGGGMYGGGGGMYGGGGGMYGGGGGMYGGGMGGMGGMRGGMGGMGGGMYGGGMGGMGGMRGGMMGGMGTAWAVCVAA